MRDKIFEGVLLASDFDATLTDSDGEILPCVTDAVKHFIDEGGLFTVCTGRTKQGFIAWNRIPTSAPVLLGNGVQGYDYNINKTVYEDAIPDNIIPFLEMLGNAFPDISIELYGTDFTTWCYHTDEVSVKHFQGQTIKWTDISSFSEAHYPLVKIMLSVNTKGKQVDEWIKENTPPFVKYIWDRGGFIEIFSVTAGKGNCLLRMAEKLGVSRDNIYAAGDGLNDIDMLRAAHIGFSPSNSQPEVLENTGIIVRDNNRGSVAHVIEILETFYS